MIPLDNIISITAGEPIEEGDVVIIKNNKAYKATITKDRTKFFDCTPDLLREASGRLNNAPVQTSGMAYINGKLVEYGKTNKLGELIKKAGKNEISE